MNNGLSHGAEAGKSKVEALADSVSDEGLLLVHRWTLLHHWATRDAQDRCYIMMKESMK